MSDSSYEKHAQGAKTVLLVHSDSLEKAQKYLKLLLAVRVDATGYSVQIRRLNGSLYKANPVAPHITKYPELMFLHGQYVSGKYKGRLKKKSIRKWIRTMAALDDTEAESNIESLIASARGRDEAEAAEEAAQDTARIEAVEALYSSVPLV